VRTRIATGFLIALLLGLILATGVAGLVGLRDVAAAVAAIGGRGLVILCLYAPIPMILLGGAWFALAARQPLARLRVFVWARLVRDASGELLPFSHLGGFLIGARAAVVSGVESRTAVSTTVADITAELLAQLGFTGLGLGLLISRLRSGAGSQTLVLGVVAGLALSALGAAVFLALQRRGGRLVERLAERILPSAAASAGDLGAAIAAIYDRPWRVAWAVGLHFCAWMASATGVWLALRGAGVEIDLGSVLAIESLVAAARSALVMAPMGIGVQEATYALVGPIFGLGPELALALSFIKRARDFVVGAPALMAWQAMEGARVLGRRGRSARLARARAEPAPAPAQG
jgi:putative membrane protein